MYKVILIYNCANNFEDIDNAFDKLLSIRQIKDVQSIITEDYNIKEPILKVRIKCNWFNSSVVDELIFKSFNKAIIMNESWRIKI